VLRSHQSSYGETTGILQEMVDLSKYSAPTDGGDEWDKFGADAIHGDRHCDATTESLETVFTPCRHSTEEETNQN